MVKRLRDCKQCSALKRTLTPQRLRECSGGGNRKVLRDGSWGTAVTVSSGCDKAIALMDSAHVVACIRHAQDQATQLMEEEEFHDPSTPEELMAGGSQGESHGSSVVRLHGESPSLQWIMPNPLAQTGSSN